MNIKNLSLKARILYLLIISILASVFEPFLIAFIIPFWFLGIILTIIYYLNEYLFNNLLKMPLSLWKNFMRYFLFVFIISYLYYSENLDIFIEITKKFIDFFNIQIS